MVSHMSLCLRNKINFKMCKLIFRLFVCDESHNLVLALDISQDNLLKYEIYENIKDLKLLKL